MAVMGVAHIHLCRNRGEQLENVLRPLRFDVLQRVRIDVERARQRQGDDSRCRADYGRNLLCALHRVRADDFRQFEQVAELLLSKETRHHAIPHRRRLRDDCALRDQVAAGVDMALQSDLRDAVFVDCRAACRACSHGRGIAVFHTLRRQGKRMVCSLVNGGMAVHAGAVRVR